MKRLTLFLLLIFIVTDLKAQIDKSLTVGLGAGAATTFAGAAIIKTTAVASGTASYYLSNYFDLSFEAQLGKLAGGNPNTTHLNFVNKFQAGFIEFHQHFGIFIEDPQNVAESFFSNVYVGTGFGLINNNVTQINATIDRSYKITPVIPIKFGYIWAIKGQYDDEIVKVNLSCSINPTIGRGIDGYYGNRPQAEKVYTYYSIGVEYVIDLTGNYGRKNPRF